MQNKSEQKVTVQTIEEIEKWWDAFSVTYVLQFAPNLSPISVSMLNMLNIEKKSNILEIAVGPGYYLPHLIQRKNPKAKLYLTDISVEFLAMCKQRIDNFLENPITGPYTDLKFDKLPKLNSDSKINYEDINTVIQKANSEDLSEFQDNSIDAYISSLCLNLTNDPIKQIKECYRVLQPGGQAIFSVWGEKSRSLMVNHVQLAFQKHNIPLPSARSNFHLNDQKKLIEMFKEHGFTDILSWHQFMPLNMIVTDEQVKNSHKSPKTVQMLENCIPDEKLRQEVCNSIEQILFESLKTNNYPIGMDTLSIMVTKPL